MKKPVWSCLALLLLALTVVAFFVAPVSVYAESLPPAPGEKPARDQFLTADSDNDDVAASAIEENVATENGANVPAAEEEAVAVVDAESGGGKDRNGGKNSGRYDGVGPLTHIGGLQTYMTAYEDTFLKIARAHNLGFVELRAANPDIDPWMPGKNRRITLPTMHLIPQAPQEGLIINLPEMRLYHFPKNAPPRSFPIGIGRSGLSTPQGRTHIRAKTEGPTWRPTKRMREEDPSLPAAVPPGPQNPLGTHMLYLAWPEYGIHGTNKPYGIGRRVSSGCIRMYPEGILELYPDVTVNDPVSVVNQPLKLAWIDGDLYLEAHPTIDQADHMEAEGGLPDYTLTGAELSTVFKALDIYQEEAGETPPAIDWETVRRVIRERRGYPIVITARNAGVAG